MRLLFLLLSLVVQVLILAIVVRAVLTWVPNLKWRFRGLSQLLDVVVEPIERPFRGLIPPRSTGGLDLSPIFAILGLRVLLWIVRLLFVMR